MIVEKPVSFVPEEVLELQEIAETNNLQYSVIHQNRFNPSIVALKKAMDSNRFKRLILSSINPNGLDFRSIMKMDAWNLENGWWSSKPTSNTPQMLYNGYAAQ